MDFLQHPICTDWGGCGFEFHGKQPGDAGSKGVCEMKKRTRMILLTGLLLGICFGSVPVSAGDGKLSIDNTVISQQGNIQGNGEGSTLYQIAPDLFLSKKNQQEQERMAGQSKQLALAKNQKFTQTEIKNEFQTKKILVGLFVTEQMQSEDLAYTSSTATSKPMPKWVFWSLALVVASLAGVGGVFLGQKYARIFRKKDKRGK
jgi:hypothetical protein